MPDQPGKTTKKKARPVNLDTLGLEMGNKPPQALEVEEAVLGAMLIEPSSVDTALEELTVSCFYDPRHRMIFEAMTSLVNEHVSVDIVTVSAKLREKGNLEAVGGPVALAGLSEKVGAAAHIEYYVRILKQKNIQRELITASYEILRDAYDDSVKVGDLIDDSQSRIYNDPEQCEDRHPGDRLCDQRGDEGGGEEPEGFRRSERGAVRIPVFGPCHQRVAEI